KNKDYYLQFILKKISHITDPRMILKQIDPKTLALKNETFNYYEVNNAIEISEKDDMSIIEMFYKHITDKELSDIQSKKIKNILENELRKED
ncbi:exonuclease sbcCD subunit D, partial [Staphylococcus aureus]|nr:exonuclease sbcCD subunit D [Staphylococcus aureus]